MNAEWLASKKAASLCESVSNLIEGNNLGVSVGVYDGDIFVSLRFDCGGKKAKSMCFIGNDLLADESLDYHLLAKFVARDLSNSREDFIQRNV
jgi:hypothetical protein